MTHPQYLLICLLALATVAPLSTEVLADGSASSEFTVTAQVPGVCSLPLPQITGTAVNATFAGSAITITQFTDPNNARVIPSTLSLLYQGALCNYGATLSIQSKSGGLVSKDAAPLASAAGTFLQTVPYTLQATWGPINLLLDTNSSPGGLVKGQSNGPIYGNLTLNFATAASSLPVPQGTYLDTVLIKIGLPM
jgi:hypothetical protein